MPETSWEGKARREFYPRGHNLEEFLVHKVSEKHSRWKEFSVPPAEGDGAGKSKEHARCRGSCYLSLTAQIHRPACF